MTKLISLVAAMLLCMSSVSADVLNIKTTAPQTYVVKKGDTLWDISSLFLDQAWLWPELWRNNVQIENPHLIYPGDMLRLRYENGVPVLEVVREKASFALSPESSVKQKPSPIQVLPWSLLAPYINHDQIMSKEQYNKLPNLLGDREGSPLFSQQDFVLSHRSEPSEYGYQVLRKQAEIVNRQGRVLGIQVDTLAQAELVNTPLPSQQQIIRLRSAKQETRQGDKLMPKQKPAKIDLILQAARDQRGELIGNVHGRQLSGKNDVVIVDLGRSDVAVGTVMGIYKQGAKLTDASTESYFGTDKRIEQPAYKIGELVVFQTFDKASYAWVTKAQTHLIGGETLARP